MFKDRNLELQRLEQALLEEEKVLLSEEDTQEDEDLFSEQTLDTLLEDVAPGKSSVAYQNYSNEYGQAYNADTSDTDMDTYNDGVLEADSEDPPKPRNTGVIVLVCLLTTGVLCALIYLLMRYGGFL